MIDTTAVDAGIADASGYSQQEAASVKKWLKAIDDARAFDEDARKQYAIDRRYARGDSSFETHAPLIASYIDILTAFIYARDPDVDILPADRVSGERASRLLNSQSVKDIREFARTLEIVTAQLLKGPNGTQLKRKIRQQARSGLTIGIGWIKAIWLERMGQDPIIAGQIRDLQDNVQRIEQQAAAIEEGTAPDIDAARVELQQQIAGLQAQVEVMVARGFHIDMVAAEDLTIPACVASVLDYLDAPWIAHRTFMRPDDAKAQFPRAAEKIASATSYSQRKPEAQADRKTPKLRQFSATDADAFTRGKEKDGGDFVCVHEIWNAESNQVLTVIEGLDCYAKEPFTPKPSSRFYPFFGLAFTEVDGERHPQSMVQRSVALVDEFNRTLSAWTEHRRRIKPGVIFNAKVLSAADAKKLAGGVTQEFVGVKPVDAAGNDYDMRKLLVPKVYAQIDPAVYDTGPIRAQLEAIWGIQEALSGSIQIAKTATEAEIQQSGTQARTSSMRDQMETMLQDLAQYAAEVALGCLDMTDVQEMAGMEAIWPPQKLGVEDLRMLVSVDIRAGSTGKPNTSAKQEAWAATMPILQGAIMQIGQLRRSTPESVADALEELVVETLDRTGDRLDITRFMPQEGPQMPPVDPMTGAPMMPPETAGAPIPAGAMPADMPADPAAMT